MKTKNGYTITELIIAILFSLIIVIGVYAGYHYSKYIDEHGIKCLVMRIWEGGDYECN